LIRTFIIDGYNVIYAIGEIEELLDESLEAARIGLTRLLLEFKGSRKDVGEVIMVFDGKSEGFDEESVVGPGLKSVYTRKGKEADDKILSIIKASPNPEDITVVSNDNFLYNNTRSLGARIMTVEEFCRILK